MKSTMNHLGGVIAAIVAIALLVGTVTCFSTPVGDFFSNVRKKENSIATGNIWDKGTYNPVSPELLPADESGNIAQKTEDLVGPYELHDFYLYYLLRYGFTPSKLYRMAQYALGETYDHETLIKWLETFTRRFFTQQFKRSCLPDGPAVFDVSVSPRGGWAMPSDASSALWMSEIAEIKESLA